MLTEGWDANTVTHVLGVRAFGTQLLCEQVVGRALRRQSYDLNENGLFNTEYADVLGIPFDFTAKPVIAPPQPPRETIQVKAIRPERDHLEIRFPRVEGFRVELPEERLTAEDRKSTRLNSSHVAISYAVFCLKKKKTNKTNFAKQRASWRWLMTTDTWCARGAPARGRPSRGSYTRAGHQTHQQPQRQHLTYTT